MTQAIGTLAIGIALFAVFVDNSPGESMRYRVLQAAVALVAGAFITSVGLSSGWMNWDGQAQPHM